MNDVSPLRPIKPRVGGFYETTDEQPVMGPLAEIGVLREILSELKTLNQTFSSFGKPEDAGVTTAVKKEKHEVATDPHTGQAPEKKAEPAPEWTEPGYPGKPIEKRKPQPTPSYPDSPFEPGTDKRKEKHARTSTDTKRD
jgi:hypothetical protein